MNKTRSLVLCALFCALIAVGAFIQIPMPLMVPISLQTLFVYMIAILLPPRYSFLSIGVYMLLGLIGLPIFTSGGGLGYVLKPSFGFMIGMLVGAPLTKILFERIRHKFKHLYIPVLLCLLFTTFIIYLIGIAYMYLMLNLHLGIPTTLAQALWSGCVLFLPGDTIKIVLCVLILPRLLKSLKMA